MSDAASHAIDLMHMGVPGAISAWLVRGPAGDVLIESGPASTGETLDAGLRSLGVEPASLSALLLTHIHLDHAGGAWRLARLGVPVHVHAFGAPHLIDPSRLDRSARAIYGDRFDTLWGPLEPCPAELVHARSDGDVVHAAGLSFAAVETTGHANHHHAWHALETGELFVGDAAAMRVPGTDWITVPMPPPEFDLDRWLATLDRIEGGPWTRLRLTHGGTVQDIPSHLRQLRSSMSDQVVWITGHQGPGRRADYLETLRSQAARYDVPEPLFEAHVTRGLVDMNLAGVDRWNARRAEMDRPHGP
ncbi:MAG: MBL fold metallo-hydrolase [Phycisphaerales bacterium]|jgi:glyoxylase-like metal-dependent hydrolase (beta-lactamase superfamily II)|nr:MBL fold metallo-hydrolase [Phycisphaerales bacterium]